jgi:hypothetical protein
MKAIKLMTGLILAVETVMAMNWTTMKLDVSATLREQRGGVLEKLIELPKDTVFRFKRSVGPQTYRKSNGATARSRSGWYRTIMLETVPGVSQSRINQINRKTLFISRTITAGLTTAEITRTDVEETPRVAHNPDTRLTRSVTACRDSFLRKDVPVVPMDKTLEYFARNKSKFKNQRYVSFADYSMPFSKKRYFLLDLQTCNVIREYMAHGSGNGPRGKHAKPTSCTRANGSRTNTSRPGYARVEGYHWRNQYDPKRNWTYITTETPKKQALAMYGLERRNNDLKSKGVVTHENVLMEGLSGYYRSYGCPVMLPGHLKQHQSILKKGTLFFSYLPMCE